MIDAALAPVRGDGAVLRELAAQLEDHEGAVLIRHVECFGRRSLATLAALMRGPGPRIVATADDAIEPAWATLFDVRVDVPPLRDRLEDLPTHRARADRAVRGERPDAPGRDPRVEPTGVEGQHRRARERCDGGRSKAAGRPT